jgi:cytoskeletal protein CcmA (bactofilin family)
MFELERKSNDYEEVTRARPSSSTEERPGDIRDPFELWLDSVKAGANSQNGNAISSSANPVLVQTPPPSATPSEFMTRCEMTFKGTLHIDGYFTGDVRSENGTLVLDESGEINTDIVVGVALINGTVVGNIKARQRIELGSAARVIGDLYMPALTVKPGAIFEGKCYFRETSANGNGRRKHESRLATDESSNARDMRARRRPNGKKSKTAPRAGAKSIPGPS